MACRNRQTDCTAQDACLLAELTRHYRETGHAYAEREGQLRSRVREAMEGVGLSNPFWEQQERDQIQESRSSIDCPYECWEDGDTRESQTAAAAADCPYQCWEAASSSGGSSGRLDLGDGQPPPAPPRDAHSDVSIEVSPSTSGTSSIGSLTEEGLAYLQQIRVLAIEREESRRKYEALQRREREIMLSAEVTRNVVNTLTEIFDGPQSVCSTGGYPHSVPALTVAPPTGSQAPPSTYLAPPTCTTQAPPSTCLAPPTGPVAAPPPTGLQVPPTTYEKPPLPPPTPTTVGKPSAPVWASDYPEALAAGCCCNLRKERTEAAGPPVAAGGQARPHGDSVSSASDGANSLTEWAESVARSDAISTVVSRVMEPSTPAPASVAPPKPLSPTDHPYPPTMTEKRIMQNEDPLRVSSRCLQATPLVNIPESRQTFQLESEVLGDVVEATTATPMPTLSAEAARLASISLTNTKRKLSVLVKHVQECQSCERTIKKPLEDIDRQLQALTTEFREHHHLPPDLELEAEEEEVEVSEVPFGEKPPSTGSEVSQFTIMAKQTIAHTKLLPEACSVSEYTLIPDMTESTRTILTPKPQNMSNESTWMQPSQFGVSDMMAGMPHGRSVSLSDATSGTQRPRSMTTSLGFLVTDVPPTTTASQSGLPAIKEAEPEPVPFVVDASETVTELSLDEEVESEVGAETSLVEEAEPILIPVDEEEPTTEPALPLDGEVEPEEAETSLVEEAEPVPEEAEPEPITVLEEEPGPEIALLEEAEAEQSSVVEEQPEPEVALPLVEEAEPEPIPLVEEVPMVEEDLPEPTSLAEEEPVPEAESPLVEEEPEPEAESPLVEEEPEPEAESPLVEEEPEPEAELPMVEAEPEPEDTTVLVEEVLEPEDALQLVEEGPEPEETLPLVEEPEEAELPLVEEEPEPEVASPLVEEEPEPETAPPSVEEAAPIPVAEEPVAGEPEAAGEPPVADDKELTCPYICPKQVQEDKPKDATVVLGTGETYLDDLESDIKEILSETGAEPLAEGGPMAAAGDEQQPTTVEGGAMEEEPATEEAFPPCIEVCAAEPPSNEIQPTAEPAPPEQPANEIQPTAEPAPPELPANEQAFPPCIDVCAPEPPANEIPPPPTQPAPPGPPANEVPSPAPPELPANEQAFPPCIDVCAPEPPANETPSPTQPAPAGPPATMPVTEGKREVSDNDIAILHQILFDQTKQIQLLVELVKKFPQFNKLEPCACCPSNMDVETVSKMRMGLEKLKEATANMACDTKEDVVG